MAEIDIPVLVVGAGPVGLSLGVDLGTRGIDCTLVEQSDGTIYHPRATAINARSMEFMRRWGVAAEVKKAAAPEGFPHTALYVTTLTGFEIARIERPHHGGNAPTATSPERPQRCNQLWLDPILLERAKRLKPVRVRYRTRCESVREEGDRVVATVRDLESDTVSTIAAQYLVDCSGGHSAIREALGIKLEGRDRVEYNLSVFVRAPALWEHHDKGKAALIFFIDRRGLWRNMILLDGHELYRFGLTGRDYYDAPDQTDAEGAFNAAIGKPIPHEIISVRRWSARDAVADGFGTARIFLAGDAAHINNPSGGFGLNTGLGDVVDLGWKLEAVLKGWGGPNLLPSYALERRPVAVRNVDQAATNRANDRERAPPPEIEEAGPAGERARHVLGAAIVASQTKQFVSDGTALGYRYEGSPIIVSDGTHPPPDPAAIYHPTARPGSRAPHGWMRDGRSIIDLYGTCFVLLRFRDGDPGPLARAFDAKNVPLQIAGIDEPALAALYERKLVLVRPDGHVAWRGDTPPADPMQVVETVRGG